MEDFNFPDIKQKIEATTDSRAPSDIGMVKDGLL